MKTEIIPVIHMTSSNQVLENVATCINCGIEKVFLINHVVSAHEVLMVAREVKKQYPTLWVGINMLGVRTENAIMLDDPAIDGLWCDASISMEESLCRQFKGMFFGGLAFKYQPQPKDLEAACREAMLTTDVATTSGSATAKAAAVEKITTIRGYLGDHPMAIASGVSAENISDYIGLVNYLLVASSITDRRNEMIIEEKLRELKSKL